VRFTPRLSPAGYAVALRKELKLTGRIDPLDTILMKLVREVVKDRRVLQLIRGWLTAGVMEEGNVRYEASGTPQGGLCKALHSPPYAKKVTMQSKLRFSLILGISV
jgi:hypothetical protein